MNQLQLEKTISLATTRCKNSGKNFTEKRQQVLAILLQSQRPLSAYELTEQYNKVSDIPILAMSVYRILDFLESVDLVHRLKSENKFIACGHPKAGCKHSLSMFLICSSCNKVIEMNDVNNTVKALFNQLEFAGFSPKNSQLEIAGVCGRCNVK
jgi:Fur family zinc uptake transcriptional regulator